MEAIEQSTHGGFSNVSTRRGVSSANYEEPMYIRADGEVLRIMLTVEALDENNQYGGKMTKKLCRGGFRHRVAHPDALLHECKTLVQRYDKMTIMDIYFKSAWFFLTSITLVEKNSILLHLKGSRPLWKFCLPTKRYMCVENRNW